MSLCCIRTIEYNEDRISDLPDDIMAQILSCLPTKFAVRTSILSRGWKYKWNSIYDIHIEGKDALANPALISFVDNVFHSTRDSRIRSFRFIRSYMILNSQISSWISTALSRGIQKLEIESYSLQHIVLPTCLIEYSSLQELKITLRSCTFEISTTMNCFSNLKLLYLDGGHYGRFNILNRQSPNTGQLLLNFPVLRDLELQNWNFIDVKSVEIRAPELISFHSLCHLGKVEDYRIKIYGPKLVKFCIFFGYLSSFVLNAQSVYYVKLEHLRNFETLGSRARTILDGVPGLACLKLSDSVVEALVHEKRLTFPKFDCLKRLEVQSYDAKTLMKILQWMPYLEYLNIIYCRENIYSFNFDEQHLLPLCIVSHLKEVKFYGYREIGSEFYLIKFFTETAKKLERVIVYRIPGAKCKKIRGLLRTLVLESSSCCINVFEQASPCTFEQEI